MKAVLAVVMALLLLQVFEISAQRQCFKDGNGFLRCVDRKTPTMIKDGNGFMQSVGGNNPRKCFKDGSGFMRCV